MAICGLSNYRIHYKDLASIVGIRKSTALSRKVTTGDLKSAVERIDMVAVLQRGLSLFVLFLKKLAQSKAELVNVFGQMTSSMHRPYTAAGVSIYGSAKFVSSVTRFRRIS